MDNVSPSNYQLMNVRELINTAFGDIEGNTVNFRLIQTVLYLIARQLKILERNVDVSVPTGTQVPETSESFKVTEVKIHAAQGKPEETETGKSKKKTEGPSKTNIRVSDSKLGLKNKKGGKGQSVDPHYLEEYVDMSEKELRVIHQRADSHEQPDEKPKPMAPVEDKHYEKFLVVERVPSSKKALPEDGEPKIAIVSHKQFMELSRTVDELAEKLKPVGSAGFPENQQLMADLRKNASLTDAMAALQLSARLEATEKVLGHMVAIVTDVVSAAGQASGAKSGGGGKEQAGAGGKGKGGKKKTEPDKITMKDLESALEKVASNMKNKVNDISSEAVKIANSAFKVAASVETRLASSEDVGPRIAALEHLVGIYSDQINALDTFLSSQVTNYQEQITQMQHELEVGLEAMNEALANAQGGDTVAVAELNENFINLQTDYETMAYRQKNLHNIQEDLAGDLKDMWKQIEMLRESKSDRDEVADALRDKAGIKDLNGIVSIEQFDAVRGDLEKQISASYDKFNNQEIVWQKAIDDVLRELSEKADINEVLSLQDSITKFINDLKGRINVIASIVGEPRTAALNKKIFRDAPCICCSTPAVMDAEEPRRPPLLPKSGVKKKEEEIEKPTGDGDHNLCYPGFPIPHPPHPRAHYCRRYCGGSHTLTSNLPRATAHPIIRPEARLLLEKVEQQRVPCLPCQKKVKHSVASNAEEPDKAKSPEMFQKSPMEDALIKDTILEMPLPEEIEIEVSSKAEEAPKEEAKLPQTTSIMAQRKADVEKSVMIVG